MKALLKFAIKSNGMKELVAFGRILLKFSTIRRKLIITTSALKMSSYLLAAIRPVVVIRGPSEYNDESFQIICYIIDRNK